MSTPRVGSSSSKCRARGKPLSDQHSSLRSAGPPRVRTRRDHRHATNELERAASTPSPSMKPARLQVTRTRASVLAVQVTRAETIVAAASWNSMPALIASSGSPGRSVRPRQTTAAGEVSRPKRMKQISRNPRARYSHDFPGRSRRSMGARGARAASVWEAGASGEGA
jgi:hypothetical protein